jgi:hypothetical protein
MTVTWQELAKKYLKDELSRMFSNSIEDINDYLKSLDDETLNRLLFALSTILRANSMHEFITDDSLSWRIESIQISNTFLEGFHNHEITDLLRTPDINHNPQKLIEYIKNDNGFRIKYEELIKPRTYNPDDILFGRRLVNAGDRMQIIDGGHRLINLVLNRVKSCKVYVYDFDSRKNSKSSIPQSIFFWLKRLFVGNQQQDVQKFSDALSFITSNSEDKFDGIERYLVREVSQTEKNLGIADIIKGENKRLRTTN